MNELFCVCVFPSQILGALSALGLIGATLLGAQRAWQAASEDDDYNYYVANSGRRRDVV